MLRKFEHQVGSVYKRLYKDAGSTKHKAVVSRWCKAIEVAGNMQKSEVYNTSI